MIIIGMVTLTVINNNWGDFKIWVIILMPVAETC